MGDPGMKGNKGDKGDMGTAGGGIDIINFGASTITAGTTPIGPGVQSYLMPFNRTSGAIPGLGNQILANTNLANLTLPTRPTNPPPSRTARNPVLTLFISAPVLTTTTLTFTLGTLVPAAPPVVGFPLAANFIPSAVAISTILMPVVSVGTIIVSNATSHIFPTVIPPGTRLAVQVTSDVLVTVTIAPEFNFELV